MEDKVCGHNDERDGKQDDGGKVAAVDPIPLAPPSWGSGVLFYDDLWEVYVSYM